METKLKIDSGIKKIEVCDMDENPITVLRINVADADTAKKFLNLANKLDEIANDGEEKSKVFKEKYKEYMEQQFEDLPDEIREEVIVNASNIRIEVLENMIEEIDGLFGKDTICNVFRECYEINEDFVPDEQALIDFINQIMPVMNELFDIRAQEIGKKYNPNRKQRRKK